MVNSLITGMVGTSLLLLLWECRTHSHWAGMLAKSYALVMCASRASAQSRILAASRNTLRGAAYLLGLKTACWLVRGSRRRCRFGGWGEGRSPSFQQPTGDRGAAHG